MHGIGRSCRWEILVLVLSLPPPVRVYSPTIPGTEDRAESGKNNTGEEKQGEPNIPPITASFLTSPNRIFPTLLIGDEKEKIKQDQQQESEKDKATTRPLNGSGRSQMLGGGAVAVNYSSGAEKGGIPVDLLSAAIIPTPSHARHQQKPHGFTPTSLFHTSPFLAALLCLAVTMLILSTLVGNCMVCLAVVLVRKLKQQPANLLLVSLAVADFCVALLVMPIALLDLLEDRWMLGDLVCRFWTSADLTLCSASILNLCMISVDRYLAVTRALRYSALRTRKRILCYIAIVWIGALLVAATPLVLLPPKQVEYSCQVSQNQLYQIYATLISFYAPCLIMVVVYIRMWRAAKRMQERDKLALKWTLALRQTAIEDRTSSSTGTTKHRAGRAKSDGVTIKSNLHCGNYAAPANHCSNNDKSGATVCSNTANNNRPNALPARQSSAPNTGKTVGCRSDTSHFAPLFAVLKSHMGRNDLSDRGKTGSSKQTTIGAVAASSTTAVAAAIQSPIVSPLKRSQRSSGFLNNLNTVVKIPLLHHGSRLWQLHERSEDKARITLGVMMGVFIICWLPFFILALAKSQSDINIPKWLDALVLWLGYSNSLLNPLIYCKYHRDFRVPFREMLCCRCSTMQTVLKNESFYAKYGPSPCTAAIARANEVVKKSSREMNGAPYRAPARTGIITPRTSAARGTSSSTQVFSAATASGNDGNNNNNDTTYSSSDIVAMVNEHHSRSRHYPQRAKSKRNSTPCMMDYLITRPSRIIGDDPIEE